MGVVRRYFEHFYKRLEGIAALPGKCSLGEKLRVDNSIVHLGQSRFMERCPKEPHIERCVVRNQDGPFAYRHEIWEHFRDDRLVPDHLAIDSGYPGRIFGYIALGIHELLDFRLDHIPPKTNRPELDDPVETGVKPGCLEINGGECCIQDGGSRVHSGAIVPVTARGVKTRLLTTMKNQAYGKRVNFQQLLDEQAFEHDDIRWYRAEQIADELITLSENRDELTRRIWSGELERTLRSLADTFVRDIQDGFERGLIDESDMHRLIAEIAAAKKRRNRTVAGD